MFENAIFLSYRRTDTAPHTLALKLELEDQFRAAQVFVDTHEIQGADRWAREIEVAIRAAKVVVPVIGRDWAGTTPDGSRRIDDPEDWVRREVAMALQLKSGAVLPVLVDGANPPGPKELPPDCADLAAIQALPVDLASWHASVGVVVNVLSDRFGFARKQTRWRYPKPDPLIAKTIAIPWEQLEEQVRTFLPQWSVEFSDDDQRLHHKRIELARTFEFDSFPEAIAFVDTVAEHAEQVQHHPRWMNVFKTVTVWLSTWDAGHRVTALDIEFARYLERTHRKSRARS